MLTSKVALVTGSTMGVGLAIARALASKGTGIIMTDLPGNEELINECQESIKKDFNVPVSFIPADLSVRSDVYSLAETAIKQHSPGPDILINNAGFVHMAHVEDYPDDIWDGLLAVMLTAPFLLTKSLLPGMRSKGWGRIININSVHGLVGTAGKSGYCAAKHGLMGLTKSAAMDLAGTGVTLNSINPSVVETRIYYNKLNELMEEKGLSKEEAEMAMLVKQPLKQTVKVDEIGEAAVFLCSPSSDVITGAHISIDGGWTAT